MGSKLPASVREWYCTAGAVDILAEHSNEDPPIPPEEFAPLDWQGQKLLPFRYENQGVCTWAVLLDGSDDPPVLVDVDSGGRTWDLLDATFSNHLYSCVWDYRLVMQRDLLVQAQNDPLGEAALAALAAKMKPGQHTGGWPGSRQYRFTHGEAALLIWAADDQADWFIGAPDAATLEATLRMIWEIDSVGSRLYACTPPADPVLGRIRGQGRDGPRSTRTPMA